MSTEEKSEDTQLRIRKITNGFLVLSKGAQFYCSNIDNVLDRIDQLLTLNMKPFEGPRKPI